MKKLILLFPLLALVACSQGENTSTSDGGESDTIYTDADDDIDIRPADGVEPPSALTECYVGARNRDSVFMQLTIEGNTATGKLIRDNYQIDGSIGTFEGEIRGDTLLADYTYLAEGMTSVAEIVFVKKGNGWKEAFGEMEMQDGKMVYTDRGNLNYTDRMAVQPADCDNHLDKFNSSFFSQLP